MTITGRVRRVAGTGVGAAVAALVVLFGPAAAPAAADPQVDAAATAFANGPDVYVAPGAAWSPAQIASLRTRVQAAGTPVFVAILGEPSRAAAQADGTELIDRVHREGTYVIVGTKGFVARSDEPGVSGSTSQLAQQATAANPGDLAGAVRQFVDLADAAASSAGAPAVGDPGVGDPGSGFSPTPGSGSTNGLGLLVPVGVLALAGGGVYLAARGRRRHQAATDLSAVRGAAEEDVTALGEDIAGLDVPAGTGLPAASTTDVGAGLQAGARAAARADQQAALNAYDRAKAALAAATAPEDLRAVGRDLEEGRWRMECARARLAGRPVPERRAPCFFNPRHGPSVTDAEWTPPGGEPRPVPVCAADADRLAHGTEPESRQVLVGSRRMPYYQAPAAFSPWAGGYYGGWGGGGFLDGLLVGSMFAGPGIGWGAGGGFGGVAGGPDSNGGGDFAGGFDTGAGGGWGGGGGGDWGGDSGGGGW